MKTSSAISYYFAYRKHLTSPPKPNMAATSKAIQGSAKVISEVLERRPDYRAFLLVVSDILPRPSDTQSEALL